MAQNESELTSDRDDKWEWEIEPMRRFGYFISIYKGMLQIGPDGGPYMCFGTRKRAIRKATRLRERRVRADGRQARLSMRSE